MNRKPRKFCGEGHEMTPDNTYTHNGSRHCRECRKINSAQRNRTKKIENASKSEDQTKPKSQDL